LPALEAYVQTSIWTEAALGVNPIEFLTGITTTGGVTSFRPGSDGDRRITLPEILGAGPGGIGGNFTGSNSLQAQIATNLNGVEGIVMAGLKSAGVGIGFRLVSKMTRKARSGLNRQILKPLGVSTMVRL
jgi:hypothetical protein